MKMNINGYFWQIKFVEENSEKLIYKGEKCLGICYFEKQKIYINGTLEDKRLKSTIVHELVHAFIYCYDIEIPTDDPDEAEEVFCDFVGDHIGKIHKLALKIYDSYKKEW